MAEDHRISNGFAFPFKDVEPTIMNPIDTVKQEYSRVKTQLFQPSEARHELTQQHANPCYGFHLLKVFGRSINDTFVITWRPTSSLKIF